jgi:dTDP-4-dehydrorhamnose reductase
MKILVLGSKGQLGLCLSDQLSKTLHQVTYASREEIDVGEFGSTQESIIGINPDLVINATAYTSVDEAEKDKESANLINHLAVANIADTCRELDCLLVHISTDYVFDGKALRSYVETDNTNPQGVYGLSKLNGEVAIQSSGCRHLIIRTAWVFSEYGTNFMKTMLRLGVNKDSLSIVGDQFGCPTYGQDIASAIVTILDMSDVKEIASDVYHYCGDESCSWFDFAEVIFAEAAKAGYSIPIELKPITTIEYPTLAARPANSALDCSKIFNTLGISPSDWRQGVKTVLGLLS